MQLPVLHHSPNILLNLGRFCYQSHPNSILKFLINMVLHVKRLHFLATFGIFADWSLCSAADSQKFRCIWWTLWWILKKVYCSWTSYCNIFIEFLLNTLEEKNCLKNLRKTQDFRTLNWSWNLLKFSEQLRFVRISERRLYIQRKIFMLFNRSSVYKQNSIDELTWTKTHIYLF